MIILNCFASGRGRPTHEAPYAIAISPCFRHFPGRNSLHLQGPQPIVTVGNLGCPDLDDGFLSRSCLEARCVLDAQVCSRMVKLNTERAERGSQMRLQTLAGGQDRCLAHTLAGSLDDREAVKSKRRKCVRRKHNTAGNSSATTSSLSNMANARSSTNLVNKTCGHFSTIKSQGRSNTKWTKAQENRLPTMMPPTVATLEEWEPR